jgi:hypothetical protein
MASWTAVSVRDRGRFCFWDVRLRFERFGRGRIRRDAMMRTWRSENFFSSSRVRLKGVSIANIKTRVRVIHTAAETCAIQQEVEPGRRSQWPFCRDQPQSIGILVSAFCRKAAQCPPRPLRVFPVVCSIQIWILHGRLTGSSCSYLASGDELQWSQRALQVGDVGLEVVEGIGDAGLDLRGRLPRWAVRSDLVERGRTHGDGWGGRVS